jgi:hypothetical protein
MSGARSPLGPSWVATVNSAVERLKGELLRAPDHSCVDYDVAKRALEHACQTGGSACADRAFRRVANWWTGKDVDVAWAALHTANQALLTIEAEEVVRSQVGDMYAAVMTNLSPGGDLRVKDYLKTLELLASPEVALTSGDRAQLRAIREACDSTADAAHSDARAYRNTLIQLGSLVSTVLTVVAILAWGDKDFRTVFSGPHTTPGPWYVLELELVASLAGLTGAVFALRNYSGFQFSYGLPFIQAILKGGTGAATGLFGVLLVQSGIFSTLKPQTGASVFATAIIFGYTQYLFTRLVDKQAQGFLNAAGSRNDPATNPQLPHGTPVPNLCTTRHVPTRHQGQGINHGQPTARHPGPGDPA